MLTASRTLAAFFAIAFSSLATVAADDSFYQARLDEINIHVKQPANGDIGWRPIGERNIAMFPYVVLDGPGEAYVISETTENQRPSSWPRLTGKTDRICVRTTKTGDVTGRLFFPNPDWSGMGIYKFTIPAARAARKARSAFYDAKAQHYAFLLRQEVPGSAWFRHEWRQTKLAESAGNKTSSTAEPALDNPTFPSRSNSDRIERTYELFSGGRAMSENLQLDRAMGNARPEGATVDIKTIRGITIKEIDWKPLIKDLKPTLDPLAAAIPADQHAVFFPTFSAAVLTADEADRQGTPVLHLAEPRSEDAQTSRRYQRQLGLSLTGVARLLGPQVAQSVALTGSDFSFRTGTDIAVLFEAPNPALLEQLLLAQITLAAGKTPSAKEERGNADGLTYRGFRSPDRAMCSYVARSANVVMVTNSLAQLKRLASVAKKESPSIASLPEFVFFRARYQRGQPDETALVFLSDATIRRLCGPRWRIARSRQTRDLAVMTELQAANLDGLVKKTIEPGPIYAQFTTADIGKLSLDAQGVRSSSQGSLAFLTPIIEMPLEKVTDSEFTAYERWREGYERNWSWAFDPIALRLTLRQDRLAADLTVMPLIVASEYRELTSLTAGGKFAPDAGDPHGALVHFILALNTKSPQFRQAESLVSTMSKGVTLGWMGSSVAAYIDEDPVWQVLEKATAKKSPESTLVENIYRLPIAVQFDVSNGFRLAAFLAAARTWIEQSSPDMVAWESLKYKDQPYVKMTPTARAIGQHEEMKNIAVYYAASGDALLVTPHEGLLKRAIDRQLARKAAAKPGDAAANKTPPAVSEKAKAWLGSSAGLYVDCNAVKVYANLFDRMSGSDRQAAMQVRAWSNLPILNEWKRLYPNLDPVEVHERVWKIRLICPGGGKYVWNEKYQTMESTVYGHPGEPKVGPAVVPLMSEFTTGSFGLTFEHDGVRARVSLERNATPKKP
jgi:hypothetical protein